MLAKDIPRIDRSRRISGGRGGTRNRRRRRKRFPVIWLLMLVALAAGLYWWVEQQNLDWQQLPTQLASKGREITNRSPEAVDEKAAAERTVTDRLPDSATGGRVSPEPESSSLHSPTAGPSPSPSERHREEKLYMLQLINAQREQAGLNPVALGTNDAAQIHAEAALENCFSSHWGIDGLKPYMRYSLAGGYQSNKENGSGLDYCVRSFQGYRPLSNVRSEIEETMAGWMSSPGHRSNILDPWHRQVNIGIAWDRYNVAMYQQFEGAYVEYDEIPTIVDGVLSLSGRTKHGLLFRSSRDLGVQVYYDTPPSELTQGQVARTYCYDSGLRVAGLREPLTGNAYWLTSSYEETYEPCPSPYDVPADVPAPRSPEEAHRVWQEAFDASNMSTVRSIRVPWVTASHWVAKGEQLAVRADIGQVLESHGPGVYSIIIWGKHLGEDMVVSQHSMFYKILPPDTYNADPQ